MNQKLQDKYNAGVTAGRAGYYTAEQYAAQYVAGYTAGKASSKSLSVNVSRQENGDVYLFTVTINGKTVRSVNTGTSHNFTDSFSCIVN